MRCRTASGCTPTPRSGGIATAAMFIYYCPCQVYVQQQYIRFVEATLERFYVIAASDATTSSGFVERLPARLPHRILPRYCNGIAVVACTRLFLRGNRPAPPRRPPFS